MPIRAEQQNQIDRAASQLATVGQNGAAQPSNYEGADLNRPAQQLAAQKIVQERKFFARTMDDLEYTEQPISTKQAAMTITRLNAFDKANNTKLYKNSSFGMILDQFRANYARSSRWQMYQLLKRSLGQKMPDIEAEFHDEMTKAHVAGDDRKANLIASALQNIKTGRWLQTQMPKCANRARLEAMYAKVQSARRDQTQRQQILYGD